MEKRSSINVVKIRKLTKARTLAAKEVKRRAARGASRGKREFEFSRAIVGYLEGAEKIFDAHIHLYNNIRWRREAGGM